VVFSTASTEAWLIRGIENSNADAHLEMSPHPNKMPTTASCPQRRRFRTKFSRGGDESLPSGRFFSVFAEDPGIGGASPKTAQPAGSQRYSRSVVNDASKS
jgi:hypothetical protein